MHETVVLFLALLVAHLVGDFVLQSRSLVEGKQQGEPGAYLRHGAFHLAASYLAILLFLPARLAVPRLHAAVVAVVVLHLLCDYLKERGLNRTRMPPWLGFLADQALHVLALAIVTAFAFADFRSWLALVVEGYALRRETILWLLVVYLGTIFGGGYLVRLLLPEQALPPAGEHSAAELERREKELRLGMYIGWLERLLVLSAILAGSFTAAGLIVAAKSIVRFKKVERSDEFAEYFLIGTFLSILLALAGGLALRWLLWGTVDLQ